MRRYSGQYWPLGIRRYTQVCSASSIQSRRRRTGSRCRRPQSSRTRSRFCEANRVRSPRVDVVGHKYLCNTSIGADSCAIDIGKLGALRSLVSRAADRCSPAALVMRELVAQVCWAEPRRKVGAAVCRPLAVPPRRAIKTARRAALVAVRVPVAT